MRRQGVQSLTKGFERLEHEREVSAAMDAFVAELDAMGMPDLHPKPMRMYTREELDAMRRQGTETANA
jgi:hypothetical protein